MGAMNRTQRRKAEREQVRRWRQQGQIGQVLTLQKNGITEQDLNQAYKKGYDEGYMYAAEGFLKKMYAAIAKELIDAGYDNDEVVKRVRNIDHRFSVMFDAEDEVREVYNLLGVYFNVDRNAINRIEED